MIATGSSLVNGAACDVLCILLLELRGYSKNNSASRTRKGRWARRSPGKTYENRIPDRTEGD